MKTTRIQNLISTALLAALTATVAPAQAQSTRERGATFAASQTVLRQCEWVETTVVSLKSDEKSGQLDRCYYG